MYQRGMSKKEQEKYEAAKAAAKARLIANMAAAEIANRSVYVVTAAEEWEPKVPRQVIGVFDNGEDAKAFVDLVYTYRTLGRRGHNDNFPYEFYNWTDLQITETTLGVPNKSAYSRSIYEIR